MVPPVDTARPPLAYAPRPIPPTGIPQVAGQIQVVTAHYRTFFTQVMAEAFRYAGQGTSVLVVQFLKGGAHQGIDRPMRFCQTLDWFRCDLPYSIHSPQERPISPEAAHAVQHLWHYTQERMLQGRDALVVLDELSLAIHWNLIPEAQALELLHQRPPHQDVILTGPHMPEAFSQLADLISMQKLRRP